MLKKVLLAALATVFMATAVAVAPAPAEARGFGCLKAAKAAHPGKLKPKLACLFKKG